MSTTGLLGSRQPLFGGATNTEPTTIGSVLVRVDKQLTHYQYTDRCYRQNVCQMCSGYGKLTFISNIREEYLDQTTSVTSSQNGNKGNPSLCFIGCLPVASSTDQRLQVDNATSPMFLIIGAVDDNSAAWIFRSVKYDSQIVNTMAEEFNVPSDKLLSDRNRCLCSQTNSG